MSDALESLHTAHRLALRAQAATSRTVAGQTQTWPYLARIALQAARTLSLPRVELIERIDLAAQSFRDKIERTDWPGQPNESALLQVAARLHATARQAPKQPLSDAEKAEAERLILSSLWTTANVVSRSARDGLCELRFPASADRGVAAGTGDRAGTLDRLKETYVRYNAIEQLALNGLRDAPQTGADSAVSSLKQAVARWDVEAHRGLMTHRSTAVLHVLSHQQAASAKALQVFLYAAKDAEAIDSLTLERLAPVLDRSVSAWLDLSNLAADLSFAATRVPVPLLDSATELRERLHEGIASAHPAEHPEIFTALSAHLASSVSVAAATHDIISTGELRGPAGAVARQMAEHYPERTGSLVDPRDVYRGRTIVLPREIRQVLDAPAWQCMAHANDALNRSSGLDPLHTQAARRRIGHEQVSAPPASEMPPPFPHRPPPSVSPAR